MWLWSPRQQDVAIVLFSPIFIMFANLHVGVIILIKLYFSKFDFITSIHQWIMSPILKKIVITNIKIAYSLNN